MSNAQVSISTVANQPNPKSRRGKRGGKQAHNKANGKSNKSKPNKVAFAGPTVKVAVATSRRLEAQRPKTSTIANGIMVDHTELIGAVSHGALASLDVEDNALLTAYRLRCNPGSAKTFNWLSTLAPNFENYKFKKLSFYFETRCPTTTAGSIIISPDYDAADGQVAVSEQSLFNNKGSVDDAVYKHIRCNLKPASMNRLYKSHVNMSDDRFEASAQDEKTIDCAQVFVCIDPATTAATKYGKLFVSYVVELTEPQSPTDPANRGGVALSVTTNGGANFGPSLSASPIINANALPLGNVRADPGIFQQAAEIPGMAFPSATLGRFIRDYTGDLIVSRRGTGLGTGPLMYAGTSSTTPAGSLGDVLLDNSISFPQIVNATNIDQMIVKKVIAKAGDFLKTSAGTHTTIDNFNVQLGGMGLGIPLI